MEKQCNKCGEVKPLEAFPPTGNNVGTGRRGHCRECHREVQRANYGVRTKAGPWTVAEDEVITDNYMSGGAGACVPLLPGRTLSAIQQRACRLGMSQGYSDSIPWPLPQQDSAMDHLLFQRTRVPVFASALVGVL